MKNNTLIKLMAGGFAGAMALATVFAQDTTTTTATTGATSVTSTNTDALTGTGTITTFTPGSDYIMFRTQTSAEPVRYYYTKTTTVVDPEGKVVAISALRPDMPVTYTYTKDGDRTVISKITLTQPISYYEKKETTTTTTTP